MTRSCHRGCTSRSQVVILSLRVQSLRPGIDGTAYDGQHISGPRKKEKSVHNSLLPHGANLPALSMMLGGSAVSVHDNACIAPLLALGQCVFIMKTYALLLTALGFLLS